MHFRLIERPGDAFQEPVTAEQVRAMCRRVLGEPARVRSATEMGWGSYNTALQVGLADGATVVLRIAPRPERQMRSERHWLRSEYAAAAWLTGLGPLVPRVLGADFTHQVIGRDYLVQSFLPGVPAPDRLPAYDRKLWPGFFGQIGAISRQLHSIAGGTWGPLAAPIHVRWSDALLQSLADSQADLARWPAAAGRCRPPVRRYRASPGPAGSRRAPPAAARRPMERELLDPRASEPVITGVVDGDRAWWGDPLADWAIYRADSRAVPAERGRVLGGVRRTARRQRNRAAAAALPGPAPGRRPGGVSTRGHLDHLGKVTAELRSLLPALG